MDGRKASCGAGYEPDCSIQIRGKNANAGINYGHIGDVNIGNSRGGAEELSRLLSQMQSTVAQAAITEEERKEADEYLSIIAEEAERDKPRINTVRRVCDGLKNIMSSPLFRTLVDKALEHF